MHEFRTDLQLSLKAQVLVEVERCISEIKESSRIDAAEQVVEFLTSGEDHAIVELSVKFMEGLTRFMIVYVNKLVSERVAIIRSANPTDNDSEILICDRLLRSLRDLQSDMSNRVPIHEGTYTPLKINHQPNKIPPARFDWSGVPNIDKLVERSILTRSSSFGYYMGRSLTNPPLDFTGNLMRARARFIAYLFLCSQQMDSFFIGIDMLRQTGQHVSNVLTGIFLNTSIKFVRDRIWNHLSHKQLSSSSQLSSLIPLIRRFEQRYPINCYETQMNRQWSAIEAVTVGQGGGGECNHSVPLIECGNIADVSPSLLGDHAGIGNIGNLSLDESNKILRCANCASVDHPTPTTLGEGYMHLTVSWLQKMTQNEIKMIFLDDDSTSADEKFEFLTQKHDWSNLLKLLEGMELEKLLTYIHQFKVPNHSPIAQIVNEKIFSQAPTQDASPHSLAKVGLLFTGETPLPHKTTLAWLMDESSKIPPQVVPLYLRRYGLWGENFESLNDDEHRIQIHGRLGIPELPKVSRWMSARNPDYNINLIRLCEWMFEGVPTENDMVWITENFPQLEQFVRPINESFPEASISTIYDLTTHYRDISIRDLLADVYPEWCGWDLEYSDDSSKITPPSLEYLLAQGRPSRAFIESEMSPGTLQLSARRVAFYNLFDDGIVASAISFLDLSGESTETLRVDVQSARAILGPNHVKKRLDEVVSVFLSFTNAGHSDNLLKALKMLEEAAWIQEPPTGSGGDTMPSAGTAAGESPWHLVALFCRVHNLPRSLTLLHELARNGDWVMFLHESDLQQCPIDTVRDVVRLYFIDNPLRAHLNILLEQGGNSGDEQDDMLQRSFVVETPPPPLSPAEMLAKYLSLFQFENARKLIEAFPNEESLEHVLHSHNNESFLFESEVKALSRIFNFNANESVSTPIAVFDDDIGSLDASSFKGTLRGSSSSGVMVESLLTDDEDDAVLLDQIRQALATNTDLGNLREKVDHEGLFRQVYSLIVNHLGRVNVETEENYMHLVRLVSMDVRENFGVFLLQQLRADVEKAPELETIELRRDVCILAYYTISTSFSDDQHDRLMEYIKTDPRLGQSRDKLNMHVTELRIEEIETKRGVDVTISANKMLDMCRKRRYNSEPTVADLHCLLKVGRIYEDRGMLRRHIEVNDELNLVFRRFKSSGLV